ncbi:MAG: sodium:solute symporter family protein [Planctomycetota bacterium]
MASNLPYQITLFAYLAVLVGVGVWKMRAVKGQDEFMVAGRSVSWVYLAGTLVCTWIGSGSLFGGAGRAFREGFSALWGSAGAWVGLIIVFFLAPRVRRIAEYTVPDMLELRYSRWARLMGTIAIVIAYVTIAAYQFKGGGRLYHLVTGGDVQTGQIISCLVVVVFTLLAGMLSIVTFDIFNGILMIIGILIALPLAYEGAGGWERITQTLPATHFTPLGKLGFMNSLGLFLPTFFLLLGESSMYQKFFSAKDEGTARKALIGMVIGVVFMEAALETCAIFGAGHYFHDPAFQAAGGGLDKGKTESIILHLARWEFPPVAGCLLLGAGLAIIFSTANTFLVIPSTNIARDVYQRFLRPRATSQQVMRFQRIMIVVLGLVAMGATFVSGNILAMALYAYTMVGAAVTPALLACFFFKRVTPAAGTASIAAGTLTTLAFGVLGGLWTFVYSGAGAPTPPSWLQHLADLTSEFDADFVIFPSAAVSILLLFVVSYLSKPSAPEKLKPFFPDA